MANTTSVMRELRHLMPAHQITQQEGKELAERQAALLLVLSRNARPGSDIGVLAGCLGVELVAVADLVVAAMIEFVHGTWLLLVRGHQKISRRRMLIARHLWYAIIDNRDDMFIVSDRDALRYCADYFAQCLLMPRAWVHQAWIEGLHETRQLAQRFMVPLESMEERLKDLGLSEAHSPSRPGIEPELAEAAA